MRGRVVSSGRNMCSPDFPSRGVGTAMSSARCYLTVVRAGYGPYRQLSPLIDQKTCNIRAIVARNSGCGAVGAHESLTTVGDYAIFHWVRSRLGAGLPRSPQNSAGPKGSQTLELFPVQPARI